MSAADLGGADMPMQASRDSAPSHSTPAAAGAVADDADQLRARLAPVSSLAFHADLRAIRETELLLVEWAARLAEGICTISLRPGTGPVSLFDAYERFQAVALLADVIVSVSRHALDVSPRRVEFLEVAAHDVRRVAEQFDPVLPAEVAAHGAIRAFPKPSKYQSLMQHNLDYTK